MFFYVSHGAGARTKRIARKLGYRDLATDIRKGSGIAPEPVGVQVLLSVYAGHLRTT